MTCTEAGDVADASRPQFAPDGAGDRTMGNIKFPVTDVGSFLGFAILTLGVVIGAKHVPGLKKLL